MTNAFEIRRKKDQMKSYVAPDRKNHAAAEELARGGEGGGEVARLGWGGERGMRGEARAAAWAHWRGWRVGGKKYADGGGTEGAG